MTEHNPDGTAGQPSPWAPAAGAGTPTPQTEHSAWDRTETPPPAEPEPPAQPRGWTADPAGQGSWAAGPSEPRPQWSAAQQAEPGERVLFGSGVPGGFGQSGHDSGGTPPFQSPQYPPPGQGHGPGPRAERPAGRGRVVAGLTALALIVGGAAGAAGGYLAADSQQANNGPVTNALNTPPPAKQTATAPSGSVEAAAAKVLPSVVQLRAQNGEGSGFLISSDGMIVTNNHVVAEAAQGGQLVAVFQNGKSAKVSIVGRDPDSDVAVVKAQDVSGLTPVELGRSDDLKVGQGVVAIGSPFDLSGTVTTGIVSSLHRPTRAGGQQGEQRTVMDAIQTDAAINPGNSGGPLVDLQGRVIGINSAIYSPGSASGDAGSVGIGFAIPIDQARRTADEIAKTGKATQTVIGVSVNDNPQGGAKIQSVTPDGPAAKAGLQQGDVVTQLDDRRIDTSDALVAAIRAHAPNDTVKLVLNNGSRTVDVTLAGQPVPPN
ncbi:MAG: S1C family serine protease [Labedaea sp.]